MSNGTSEEKIKITILDRSDICKIKPDDKGNFSEQDQLKIDEFENRVDTFIEKINSNPQHKQKAKLITWGENNSKSGVILADKKIFCSEEEYWFIISIGTSHQTNICQTLQLWSGNREDNNIEYFEVNSHNIQKLELSKEKRERTGNKLQLKDLLAKINDSKKYRQCFTSSPYFSSEEVIARLRHALYCFARRPYDKNKWNGQHLARLIVENDAKNYDKKGSSLGLFEATEAEQEFTKYLNIHSPKLNPDILNHFFRGSLFKNIKQWITQKYKTLLWIFVFSITGFFLFVLLEWLLSDLGKEYTKEFITKWERLNQDLPLVNFSFGEIIFALISIVIIGLLVIVLITLINALFTQLYDWKKAGFVDKKLWDWLDLLLVPVFLAIGGFYIQFRAEQNQQSRIEQLGKQESLKAYFIQVQEIISENSVSKSIDNLGERIYIQEKTEPQKSLENKEQKQQQEDKHLSATDKRLLESFTSVTIREMNNENKAQILKLLSSLRLIKVKDLDEDDVDNVDEEIDVPVDKENLEIYECIEGYKKEIYPPVEISLSGMDLKSTKLNNIDLTCVSFRNVNLTDVQFLEKVDLRYADFRDNANLDGVSFKQKNAYSKINIRGARFGTTTQNLKAKQFPPEMIIFYETKPTNIINLIDTSINLTGNQKQKLKKLINQSSLSKEEKQQINELINQPNLTKEEKQQINELINKYYFVVAQGKIALRLENYFKELEKQNIKLLPSEKLEIENWLLALNIILQHKEKYNSATNQCEKNEVYQILINKLQEKDQKGASKYQNKLSGEELKNINFCELYFGEKFKLSNSNLSHAILNQVTLRNANLTNANLTNADLTNADLTRANLINAKLIGANLTNVNLTGAILTGADLTGANLTGAILKDAKVSKAIFKEANLNKIDLTNVNLTEVNFKNVQNLVGINLTGVNLNDADLTEVNLTGVTLTNANLINAKLFNANLSRSNLEKVNLAGADLTSANLTNAKLTEADLTNAKLIGVDLMAVDNMDKITLTNACYDQSTKFPDGFTQQEANLSNLQKIERGEECKIDEQKRKSDGN